MPGSTMMTRPASRTSVQLLTTLPPVDVSDPARTTSTRALRPSGRSGTCLRYRHVGARTSPWPSRATEPERGRPDRHGGDHNGDEDGVRPERVDDDRPEIHGDGAADRIGHGEQTEDRAEAGATEDVAERGRTDRDRGARGDAMDDDSRHRQGRRPR